MLLAPGIIAIVIWHATRARTYSHTEIGTRCLTCGAEPYGTLCNDDNHARFRHVDTKVEDKAPDETRMVQHLYGQLVKACKAASFNCGEQVYHIAAGREEAFQAAVAQVRQACLDANKSFKHAKADFYIKYLSIGTDADTVRSLKHDVELAVDKLLEAVASGDGTAIRKALRDTRNFAEVLSGQDKLTATELGEFAGKIADRLREAAREGQEAIEEVAADAKAGAQRFAGIFGEILASEEPAEEEPAEEGADCQGHPAGEYDVMGQTAYCDGSCVKAVQS